MPNSFEQFDQRFFTINLDNVSLDTRVSANEVKELVRTRRGEGSEHNNAYYSIEGQRWVFDLQSRTRTLTLEASKKLDFPKELIIGGATLLAIIALTISISYSRSPKTPTTPTPEPIATRVARLSDSVVKSEYPGVYSPSSHPSNINNP